MGIGRYCLPSETCYASQKIRITISPYSLRFHAYLSAPCDPQYSNWSTKLSYVQLVSTDTDFIRDRERNLRSSLLPGEESNDFLTRMVSHSRLIAGKTMLLLLSKKPARKSCNWVLRNADFPSRQRQRNLKPRLCASRLSTPSECALASAGTLIIIG